MELNGKRGAEDRPMLRPMRRRILDAEILRVVGEVALQLDRVDLFTVCTHIFVSNLAKHQNNIQK